METENGNVSINELEGAIEAVLFVSGEPVGISRLSSALKFDEQMIKETINLMNANYKKTMRGFYIKKIEDGYQLCTNTKYSGCIRACLHLEKKAPLSTTLLETLAIIAYMQPVTKQQIAEIRGVDAQHAVNRLMERGLICERGRSDVPGRPILFGTTDEFLRKFGFSSISEMPLTMQKIEESIGESN